MCRAVRDLEIRFLANRDANIHFALLTDPPDAAQQFDEKTNWPDQCAHLIEALNAKYAAEGKGSFFLFHRHRAYNPSEGIWMAWERKRGKLLDFNKLLLGTSDNFPVKAGNLSVLPSMKYVITLDSDTQLPRDAAHRLAGAIAHPLNRAVIDPETNTVVDGYGILQPRVDISIQSASRSRLAAIFSADAGFDIYARAASDVYQDLFDEGSFTGKGIYEVETFQQVLEHRFPCNTILSHDMIEGAYARAGLVSDIEVVDDYPVAHERVQPPQAPLGAWRLANHFLAAAARVPDFFGKSVRNPLSVISRWKILDNLAPQPDGDRNLRYVSRRLAVFPAEGAVLDAGDAGGHCPSHVLAVRHVDPARGRFTVYEHFLEKLGGGFRHCSGQPVHAHCFPLPPEP